MLGRLAHEHRDVRIIQQVIAEMLRGKAVVWDVGTLVDMRIHAERSGVDYNKVICHDFGRQVIVGDDTFARSAGYKRRLHSEIFKTAHHCFGGTARAEHKGFDTPLVEQRRYRVGKSDDVGIIALELKVAVSGAYEFLSH